MPPMNPTPPARPDPAPSRWLPLAALVVAAVVPYLNSLHGEFHFDDHGQIVGNANLDSLAATVAHSPRGRLLTFLTFHLNHRLHGLAFLPGWHVVNVALHVACVLALYAAVRRVGGGAPFVAGLLFAVHPLASEPVNYIQARAVQLYTLFTLLALGSAAAAGADMRRRTSGAAVLVAAVALAAISKEAGVFFATAVPLMYALARGQIVSLRWRTVAIAGAAAAGAIAVWLVAGGAWAGIARRLGSGFFGSHLAGQMIVFWRYVSLLVTPLPSRLSVDHYVSTRTFRFTDADVLLAAAALVALVLVGVWRIRRHAAAFWLLLIPLGLAPYFLMPTREMMVEYRLYLPLAGACSLAAMGAARVLGRMRRTGTVLLACTAATLGAATWQRNTAWRTDVLLWQDAVNKAPRKARTVNALAWALLNDKTSPDPKRALDLAIRSFDPRLVDLPPGFNPYMADTLAEAYFANGMPERAVEIARDILRRGWSDPFFQKQLEKFEAGLRSGPATAPTRETTRNRSCDSGSKTRIGHSARKAPPPRRLASCVPSPAGR